MKLHICWAVAQAEVGFELRTATTYVDGKNGVCAGYFRLSQLDLLPGQKDI